MNQFFLAILAFIGGVFLAIQVVFNAHLGEILKKPILASVAQSVSSTAFALTIVLLTVKTLPSPGTIKQVPLYLWFIGGLFSVLGISLYYYIIPKLGLSTMISIGLSGQLIFAVVAGHYGWLNLASEPSTFRKLIGVTFMLAGILLIKLK
ncbi:DMT family transporter [Dyadobacter arcticus]|uniref:Transporter family-2 protein n=1 Tax=Dyadobacter arcticus TaxID=1078754 RepID=A0ABX0UT15_9BACT|nr:DMT family transporter [Dyadobacter arcticus]NIJ56108.1 transporter family-2 protein [Dyadobacter arcticus]